MVKLNFVSDETVRIDLDEGTWVDVRKQLPFEQFRSLFLAPETVELGEKVKGKKAEDMTASEKAEGSVIALPVVVAAVVGWSDASVPCTKKNIERLDPTVILLLAQKILPLYSPEKKSSTLSEQTLSEATNERE